MRIIVDDGLINKVSVEIFSVCRCKSLIQNKNPAYDQTRKPVILYFDIFFPGTHNRAFQTLHNVLY